MEDKTPEYYYELAQIALTQENYSNALIFACQALFDGGSAENATRIVEKVLAKTGDGYNQVIRQAESLPLFEEKYQ